MHTPSASTPWLAAKAATAPGGALLLGMAPRNAPGTTGSAGELRRMDLLVLFWEGTCHLPTHRSLLPTSHGFKGCPCSSQSEWVTCVEVLVPSGNPTEPGWADGQSPEATNCLAYSLQYHFHRMCQNVCIKLSVSSTVSPCGGPLSIRTQGWAPNLHSGVSCQSS